MVRKIAEERERGERLLAEQVELTQKAAEAGSRKIRKRNTGNRGKGVRRKSKHCNKLLTSRQKKLIALNVEDRLNLLCLQSMI